MAHHAKTYNLTQNDQQKITYLITNFAKSQPNMLKYSQVIALLLDRCIFNTKLTLIDFQNVFQTSLKVAVKSTDKTQVQGERVINKDQLIFCFSELAKILYSPDPNYLQRFYLTFLSQKIQSQGGQINRARVMIIDDLSKKLLVQQVVKQLRLYSEQIRHIFISYTIQNYWALKRKKRLLLSYRQMALQNKKWSYISLILFLKQSETTPHLITIQHIQQMLRFLIPNTNTKQQQFYSRHTISQAYHKDVDGNDGAIHQGDPGIMLFQFQFLLIRLAWQTFPRELQKKDIGMIIERYLKYLYLRQNKQIQNQSLPSINRKMINKMKEYYKIISQQQAKSNQDANQQIQLVSQMEKMAKKIDKQINNLPHIGLDFHQIQKVLDKQLPKLPPIPVVKPQYTGPYDKNFAITLGKQPPPQPVQKDQKPKAQKKQAGKKDEIPPRQFKWADVPQTKKSAQQYLKDIQSKLEFQVKPLGDLSRGTIPKSGYPIIISEILFPPEIPKAVVPYIQASQNAFIERNFLLALQNLSNGVAAWKKTTIQLQSSGELFFQYSKGNIFLAAGQLQYALQIFFNCRKYSDTSRLSFNNPDRSLPYYGLGQVLYIMQQYQMASRCFLKSRQIRQSLLGLEHVQTGCVFNNLACCFSMLGRIQQSLGYIQIAEVVLDTALGSHHQRTNTCRMNMKKINHGQFDNKPQFRKFWQVFEQDLFQKKKKKKKDQAKGGKK